VAAVVSKLPLFLCLLLLKSPTTEGLFAESRAGEGHVLVCAVLLSCSAGACCCVLVLCCVVPGDVVGSNVVYGNEHTFCA